jgi:catechol 2,3-dioxygenase-like lactoylglutathione lyase family enzyme
MRVHLGVVSHFSLAVNDPAASALWWTSNFDLDKWVASAARIVLGNDAIVVSLFKGTPDPAAVGHVAFHTADLDALEAALQALRANGVQLEDPGDEIGPVAEGSSSRGLWFHDPDGYRWELFVAGPAARRTATIETA